MRVGGVAMFMPLVSEKGYVSITPVPRLASVNPQGCAYERVVMIRDSIWLAINQCHRDRQDCCR